MDFLKIRKKAKERAAAARARSDAGAGARVEGKAPPQAAGTTGVAPAPPPPNAVLTDEDVLEGELAARLQGLPLAEDRRFRTWRPDAGAPYSSPSEVAATFTAREGDFSIVAGLASAALAPRASPAGSAPGRAQVDPFTEFFYAPDEEAPDVPEVGSRWAEPAEEDHGGAVREEYLTFLLGNEEYAVAIERVREVVKSPPITEVPRAPAHILGVVTVRGEVVPVFDPSRRLGLPPAAQPGGGSRVVIVDAGEGPCGLLVDGVASVVRLEPGRIEPCPQGLSTVSAESIAGIGREGERLFMVLDLDALLRRATGPRQETEGMADAGA